MGYTPKFDEDAAMPSMLPLSCVTSFVDDNDASFDRGDIF